MRSGMEALTSRGDGVIYEARCGPGAGGIVCGKVALSLPGRGLGEGGLAPIAAHVSCEFLLQGRGALGGFRGSAGAVRAGVRVG